MTTNPPTKLDLGGYIYWTVSCQWRGRPTREATYTIMEALGELDNELEYLEEIELPHLLPYRRRYRDLLLRLQNEIVNGKRKRKSQP